MLSPCPLWYKSRVDNALGEFAGNMCMSLPPPPPLRPVVAASTRYAGSHPE